MELLVHFAEKGLPCICVFAPAVIGAIFAFLANSLIGSVSLLQEVVPKVLAISTLQLQPSCELCAAASTIQSTPSLPELLQY